MSTPVHASIGVTSPCPPCSLQRIPVVWAAVVLDVGCGQVCGQPPASSLPPRIRHGGALNLLSASPGCSDFDPFSLRMELPGAVAALAQSAAANGGTSYVHCTGAVGWPAGNNTDHCVACCPAMDPHLFDALAPQTQLPALPHTSHALPACLVCLLLLSRCCSRAGARPRHRSGVHVVVQGVAP